MGDSGDKPLRRNNSYTSYTMAICGMPLDSFRAKEGEQKGEEMEKLTWPNADSKKRIRMDSYTSYCNAVSDIHSASEIDMSVKAEMGLGDRKGSASSLEEWYDQDKPEVSLLFQFLQILTACFGSFAHGGNDVRSVHCDCWHCLFYSHTAFSFYKVLLVAMVLLPPMGHLIEWGG